MYRVRGVPAFVSDRGFVGPVSRCALEKVVEEAALELKRFSRIVRFPFAPPVDDQPFGPAELLVGQQCPATV